MGRPLLDITGQRFGRLVALHHPYKSDKWVCRCDCGNTHQASGSNMKKGLVKSCGCLNGELAANRKRTHDKTGTVEWVAWCHAKQRCSDPGDKRWLDYGGRGIRVCDEWRDDFPAFLAHMGKKPSRHHSLDRIDVNGDYEPGNVRWATKIQQANNCRNNRRIEWRGEVKTLAEWCRELRLPFMKMYHRIVVHHWTPDRAFATP